MTGAAGAGLPLLLALRALGLGDLLCAVPALRALARAFPGHRRVLAAPAWLEPVTALTGAVDALLPATALEPLAGLAAAPDMAVNLHGRGPQSHAVLLATRPRRLLAFAHPDVAATAGMPAWREGEHEVRRWCRLLAETGIDADAGDLDIAVPAVPVPPQVARATLVHPGAGQPSRRWPAARFAAVAAAERAAGRNVVVTGSAAEAALARAVAADAGLGPESVLAGRLSLLELVATVAAADRVVTADTGVAHLATALRRPSVVLFGPVPPDEWGPPPDRAWHRALWHGPRSDPFAPETAPALLALDPDEVVAALRRLPPSPAVGVTPG